jgi:hypothetical protein
MGIMKQIATEIDAILEQEGAKRIAAEIDARLEQEGVDTTTSEGRRRFEAVRDSVIERDRKAEADELVSLLAAAIAERIALERMERNARRSERYEFIEWADAGRTRALYKVKKFKPESD